MEIREKLIGFKFFQAIDLNAKLDAKLEENDAILC